MPEISFFRGIKVYVYYKDHARPHIHVKYAGKWVLVRIEDGYVIAGGIHPLALSIVREWARYRHDELLAAWDAAAADRDPPWVSPLPQRKTRGQHGRHRR